MEPKNQMKKQRIEEQILRASKEIVVKFIETGRVSPAGFPDIFKSIYHTVENTVTNTSFNDERKEDS